MVTGGAPNVPGSLAKPSQREAMYYRYLDLPNLVKGGSVVPANLVSAFAAADRSVDVLAPLPGQDHFLEGVYRTHWREGFRKYFQEHLKP
jgi:hypothetical protein